MEPEAQGPTLQTAKALAMTAIDVLLYQNLVKKMKEDFVEDMKRENEWNDKQCNNVLDYVKLT